MARALRAADELRPGQAVTVMVRPQDARIAAATSTVGAQEFKWSGRIVHVHAAFRGPIRAIVVETDMGRLNVDVLAFGEDSLGNDVSVIVPQRAAWAIPREEAIR
jgi:iron(III) transport system ATP-binding protein